MDDYERVLLVKPDVHVFRIPPRVTNRAYRASDWNLDSPDWNCRLRLISKGDACFIKLDEKSSGQFFGQCPIDKYPGPAIEPVSDSSRYFVLRLVNDKTGRTAFVGIGFVDRSDSFDLNVALQDHFKVVQLEHNTGVDTEENMPKLDLKFKEGETIKVNLNLGTKSSGRPRPRATSGNKESMIFLPPPPGSKTASAAGGTTPTASSDLFETIGNETPSVHSVSDQKPAGAQDDLFQGFNSLNIGSNGDETALKNQSSNEKWCDFAEQGSAKTVIAGDNNDLSWNEDASKPNTSGTGAGFDDLWTDFTSCNTPNTSGGGSSTTNISSTSNNNQTSFGDDWAQFS